MSDLFRGPGPRDDAIPGQKPRGPKLGDFSVCFYCGTILRFGEKGILEPASEESILSDLDARQAKLLLNLSAAFKQRTAARTCRLGGGDSRVP